MSQIDKFNPSKYGDYTRGEIIVVIQLLAAMLPVEDVITKFFNYFNKQKRITAATIAEIKADFSQFIAKKSEEYLENIKGCPFAHDRILLDACYDIYKECRKPTPSHTIKVAENQYEVVEKQDLKTSLAAVKLAIDYSVNREKLKLLQDKNKPPSMDDQMPSWELEDGLSE